MLVFKDLLSAIPGEWRILAALQTSVATTTEFNFDEQLTRC